MTALIATARRQPYLVVGLVVLIVLLAALIEGVRKVVVPAEPGFWWQVGSGTTLTAALAYQWLLLYLRMTRQTRHLRRMYQTHRWVGVACAISFIAHAAPSGSIWMNMLSGLFFLTALTGLMNREIVRYTKDWHYKLWFWSHVSISAAMVPMIALHIWVALAYEGLS